MTSTNDYAKAWSTLTKLSTLTTGVRPPSDEQLVRAREACDTLIIGMRISPLQTLRARIRHSEPTDALQRYRLEQGVRKGRG